MFKAFKALMVCKYLRPLNNILGEQYADKIACIALPDQCPKKRLILTITPQCWRFNANN